MRIFPAALLGCVLLCGAGPTLAQPASSPSAADEDRRTRLFKEGKAAADAGQWAEAAAKFREVVKIRSAPKALIALGVAEEKRGRLVAALSAYKQAREEAADKALVDELKTVSTALEAIRPRVPKLTFSPQDALIGAKLEIDGADARLETDTVLVDPGDHTVVVSGSKGTFRTSVSVGEGDQREINIVFGQAGPAPTDTSGPISPPPDKGSAKPPTGAIVISVAGLALAGAGAALYGVGSSEYDKAAALCPGPSCTQDVLSQGNGARTQIIAGDILMIAGGAALTGGILWWIVSAATGKKKADLPQESSLFVAPRPFGLTLGGRF